MAKNKDEAKGRIKEATGDLTGDEDLKREGKVDRGVSEREGEGGRRGRQDQGCGQPRQVDLDSSVECKKGRAFARPFCLRPPALAPGRGGLGDYSM